MQQDFFKTLPQEITVNILSRLPVRTTLSCKCVCKPWLNLLETPEFAKAHFSKSVPGLAVFGQTFSDETSSKPYQVFELETAAHCKAVFDFSFPHPNPIHSSADGFLLLFEKKMRPHEIFICNPITRDFIKIPSPQEDYGSIQLDTFGFGVSRITRQYKVLRLFVECIPNPESNQWGTRTQFVCQVYTLGTGSWRSIAPRSPPLRYECHTVGASLNGYFHWLALDLKGSPWISCFDIENELFSTFSSPGSNGSTSNMSLTALGERLCFCDNSAEDVIVIWLMNEYGDGNSWTKDFIISKWSPVDFYGVLCPIKVFEDGDILIEKECSSSLLCYSNETKTIQETALIKLRRGDFIRAVIYTPNFLPLKTFTMENVSSF